jgi:hypothetical protein
VLSSGRTSALAATLLSLARRTVIFGLAVLVLTANAGTTGGVSGLMVARHWHLNVGVSGSVYIGSRHRRRV